MKVKFIKEHFSGIKKGAIIEIDKETASRWIKEGYAEEVKPKRRAKTKEGKSLL